jgi:hypothetical protein
MLKIRKEQDEELGKINLKKFEDNMVEHIKEFFPKYYEIHSEPLIREIIHYTIERAESYDFVTERDVCMYINLVLLLGSNFDTDPQLPWAIKILKDETITDPATRIDRLYDKAMEYFDKVAGTENEFLGRSLLRIRDISIQNFSQMAPENTIDVSVALLEKIWPQKCRELGETTLSSLFGEAAVSAKNYNITSERGIVLYTWLMFMLGSGFDKDPQFPWAAKILRDESIVDQGKKVDQLYNEAMTFLEKWLA